MMFYPINGAGVMATALNTGGNMTAMTSALGFGIAGTPNIANFSIATTILGLRSWLFQQH